MGTCPDNQCRPKGLQEFAPKNGRATGIIPGLPGRRGWSEENWVAIRQMFDRQFAK